MNKLLNTFFFGYLSLKWRRLFRSLIIVAYLFWFWFSLYEARYHILNDYVYTVHYDISTFLLFISPPIIPIALISWVIKPFVVKEKLPF